MLSYRVWETIWGFMAMLAYAASAINYVFLDNTQDAIYFVLTAILLTLFENQARREQ